METVTVITEKKEKKRRNESSPWRQAFKKIKKNKMALVGFYALIFMFLFLFYRSVLFSICIRKNTSCAH